jgi:hypothetical protein
MAESMARVALKPGMKTWIVTNERVRTKVAELREDLDDLVVEARQEHESQADASAQTATDREATAPATVPRRKATRTQTERGGRAKTPDDTNDAEAEQTAKSVWAAQAGQRHGTALYARAYASSTGCLIWAVTVTFNTPPNAGCEAMRSDRYTTAIHLLEDGSRFGRWHAGRPRRIGRDWNESSRLARSR